MDVTRINGSGYQPPPMPGSGEFAPEVEAQTYTAPEVQQAQPAVTNAPSPSTVAENRTERAERGRDSLQRAVSEINSSIAIYRRHLGIRIHEPTNRRIVTVYDSDTNEAIREIPPESVLEAHANMLEMVGLFMDTRG